MKSIFVITIVVALWANCFCQESPLLSMFLAFEPGFGDIKDKEIKQTFIDECVDECKAIKGPFAECFYPHPYACNLFIRCLRYGNLMIVIGMLTSKGTMFDSRDNTQKETITDGIPNYSICTRAEHPCATGRPIPEDATQCGKYMVCKDNVINTIPCPEGHGFSAWTGECDVPCDTNTRRVLKQSCGSSDKGANYFFINDTVVYGDSQLPVLESLESICPAATTYQTEGKCGCDMADVIVEACKTITAIHLSSSDNSWQMAKDQKPVQGSSALSGDLNIGDVTSSMPRAGYFNGTTLVVAQGLSGNDLGLYFNLSFTFESMRSDGRTPGRDFPRDQNGPVLVALTDNGANGEEASYGCHLKVERANIGKVECYIKPSLVSDIKQSSDVVISGPDMDLTRKVSVVVSKDDALVRLVVREEGGAEQVVNRRVPRGIRAFGNPAPLAIAKSTGKRDYIGFIDDMFLKKFCGHFLS